MVNVKSYLETLSNDELEAKKIIYQTLAKDIKNKAHLPDLKAGLAFCESILAERKAHPDNSIL